MADVAFDLFVILFLYDIYHITMVNKDCHRPIHYSEALTARLLISDRREIIIVPQTSGHKFILVVGWKTSTKALKSVDVSIPITGKLYN